MPSSHPCNFPRRGFLSRTAQHFLVVLVLGTLGLASDARARSAAVVLDVRGDWWVIAPQRAPLGIGRGLAVGAVIQPPRPPTANDRLVLVGPSNRPVAYECNAPGACLELIIVSETATPEHSIVGDILDAVEALIGHDPQRYVSPISRGGLQDGVVLLRDGTIDFAPIFGTHELEGIDLVVDPGPGSAAPARVYWHPTMAAVTVPPTLTPGLHRLRAVTDSAPLSTAGSDDVWILVATTENFTRLDAAYRSARAAVASWKDRVPQDAMRGALRAWLQRTADRENQ